MMFFHLCVYVKFGSRRICQQHWRFLSQHPNQCIILAPTLFTTNLQTHHVHYNHLCLKHHDHNVHQFPPRYFSSSTQPPNTPNQQKLMTRMWTKLATTIRAFMAGTKLLYSDVKLMYEIRSKKGNLVISTQVPKETSPGKLDCKFTRKEIQFLYKTKKDLQKMLPTVVLFFIPVLGYLVPLVVFMSPQTLLSQHFWTDTQKTEFLAATDKASEEEFQTLLTSMMKTATSEQMNALSLIGNQLSGGSEPIDQKHSMLFNVKKLPKEQKNLLYGGWNVKSSVLSPYQKLLHHLCYLHLSDWMIAQEGGVDRLTDNEIFEACRERKLLVCSPETSEERKQLLQSWISLTTQFKECPLSLMAHVPLALRQSTSKQT